MKSTRLVIVISVTLLLISCSPSKIDSEAISTPQKTPLIEHTSAPAMTVTTYPPPRTATNESTSTQNEITENCIELSEENSGIHGSGILLLRSQLDLNNILNLQDSAESKLINQDGMLRSYLISPDMKHLLVEVCNNGCKYVLKNSVETINTTPSQSDWVLWQWLDNKRVIILSRIEPHNVMLLDPFTGNIEKFGLDLPDPYTIHQTNIESIIPISFNPSLSTVLFYEEKPKGKLVLWSIDNAREIASLPYTVGRSVSFSPWSPDGQRYVTVSPNPRVTKANELFEINIDGFITQLTHYNQENEFANVASPVLSPDNQHIAFWLKISTASNSNPEDLPQYLAIMDTFSLETKILCQTYSTPYYPSSSVFWSSDGQQLIANTRTNEGIVEPTLIDLVHLTKTKINTHGAWVEGWMVP
jgi:hypothetical protein